MEFQDFASISSEASVAVEISELTAQGGAVQCPLAAIGSDRGWCSGDVSCMRPCRVALSQVTHFRQCSCPAESGFLCARWAAQRDCRGCGTEV